ncbi:hypothetical protein BDL97_01G071000 [Sphagnum fallax]|nr:hypothetical protein BDL97_01G071000 [Sphagnum fallax]
MASNNDAGFFRLLAVEPRVQELTGAVDLLTHYSLREHYETFCKKPLPPSLAETHYLQNVVGDTEIRRGEGMELGELVQVAGTSGMPSESVTFHPLNFEMLRQAFTLRETGPISLPESERGLPTFSNKVKKELDDKDKKHKKKHKKHKHRDKDKDRDKEKEKKDRDKDKDQGAKAINGEDRSRKHHKKKRRHEGEGKEGDGNKHKSKKHKHSSKVEDPGVVRRNGM